MEHGDHKPRFIIKVVKVKDMADLCRVAQGKSQ